MRQTKECPQGEPVLPPSPATVFPYMMKGTLQAELRIVRVSSVTEGGGVDG